MHNDGKRWYLENCAEIQEFRKYTDRVERELTDNLKKDILGAVKKAVTPINSRFKIVGDKSGEVAYWYLPTSYDARKEKGISICVWVPRNDFAWLAEAASEINDVPTLGLWATGTNKKQSEKLAVGAREMLKELPQFVQTVDVPDDDDSYCFAEWDRHDLIQHLKKSGNMNNELVAIFKTFTEYSLPTLTKK